MYISINWIKDFVELDGIDIDELIHRFTMSTAEVEGIIKYGYDTNGVIVGKIESIKQHPNSDKLNIVSIDTGNGKMQSICGASNIYDGMLVPFAPIGSKVKGIEITKTNLAGFESMGVCLSEKELGISDEHIGVMELDKDLIVGTDIKEIMNIEDTVFEIDNKSLTHRPDLWGHYGIAREIAALTDRPLKPLEIEDLEKYRDLPKLNINIEDNEKCYRYTSIAVENITKKVSDVNMKIRLYYCGTRAINLLADITNYIMLELGQPMHAFDKSIVDHVNVRTLGKEEKFITLDGVERNIYTDVLMICKDNIPVGIAGIMGGENTEIKETTNSLFLESATFDSVSIRKSAIKLGLRTDASARYEKSLDPELTYLAIGRYIKLLKNVDKDIQIVSSVTDVYIKKYDEINIEITTQYINRLIGVEIPKERVVNILISLGFIVEENNDIFKIKVPSYRSTKDINIKSDIVEEIARIYGYDNITPKTTLGPLKIVRQEEKQLDNYIIKDVLSQKYGMSEVHTYIWYDKKWNKELNIETNNNIKIINSLNADNNVLRESMMPSLINILDKNIKNTNDVNVFEIGKVFKYGFNGENCVENENIGIVLASKKQTEEELLIKGQEIIKSIFELTKNIIPKTNEIDEPKYCWINPVNSAYINYGNEEMGYISTLNIIIKNSIDKKMNVVLIEISFDKLNKINKLDNIYKDISKYQVVNIDLSLIVNKEVKYEQIEKYISECDVKNLISYSLVDIFENEEKLGNKKSVTIKFVFGSNDHTLNNKEIIDDQESLINCFEEKGIIIRR